MKKFKVIICKILKELGYRDAQKISIDDDMDLMVFKNNHGEETQYYVVSSCNKQYFQNMYWEELQNKIYMEIKKLLEKEPAVDKNTSWLISVECDGNYEDIMSKILQIEENPYYFKKMVCPYLQDEVNGFLRETVNCREYIGFIQKEILKVNRFVDFYNRQDIVYDFFSRLLIKIPNIELPVSREQKLRNLSDEIKMIIEDDGLQDIHEFLLDNIEEKTSMIDNDINTLYELYYGKDSENE